MKLVLIWAFNAVVVLTISVLLALIFSKYIEIIGNGINSNLR